MPDLEINRCRSCNAEITWSLSLKGNRCPYDIQNGAIVTVERKDPKSDPRQSHFSTCPNARQHSRKVAK